MVSSEGPVSKVKPPRSTTPTLPPYVSACSNTSTSWPSAARRAAAASPPTPAPTTTTRLTPTRPFHRSVPARRPAQDAASRPRRAAIENGWAAASGHVRTPVRSRGQRPARHRRGVADHSDPRPTQRGDRGQQVDEAEQRGDRRRASPGAERRPQRLAVARRELPAVVVHPAGGQRRTVRDARCAPRTAARPGPGRCRRAPPPRPPPMPPARRRAAAATSRNCPLAATIDGRRERCATASGSMTSHDHGSRGCTNRLAGPSATCRGQGSTARRAEGHPSARLRRRPRAARARRRRRRRPAPPPVPPRRAGRTRAAYRARRGAADCRAARGAAGRPRRPPARRLRCRRWSHRRARGPRRRRARSVRGASAPSGRSGRPRHAPGPAATPACRPAAERWTARAAGAGCAAGATCRAPRARTPP